MTGAQLEALAQVWTGFWALIKGYQSLIAGLIAIGAAYMTAKPVWRQLRSMSVQTAMVHREFLAERLRVLEARRHWLMTRLDRYSDEVGQRMMEMRELEGRLNVHWIFERSQTTASLIGVLEEDRKAQRDPTPVASALEAVLEALRQLYETMEAIHRPQSTDQAGEDYAYTDEEWARIHAKGKQADERLDAEVTTFERALSGLRTALQTELDGLRDSLQAIDARLTASAGSREA